MKLYWLENYCSCAQSKNRRTVHKSAKMWPTAKRKMGELRHPLTGGGPPPKVAASIQDVIEINDENSAFAG